MGRPKHFSQRVSPIHMIALILMIAALTRCGGCGPSTTGNGSTPKHPIFPPPHVMGTGQVKSRQSTFEAPNNKETMYIASMLQNGDLSSGEEPMATTPLSQSRVTLQMPTGSFPPNDVLTLIANNFQFKVGDFITVVATPNGDGTFTAQQITKASMSAFQNQVIEYQGTATVAVTCQTTCAGQSISFVVGRTNFSFTMSSDTTVTGFGSPASIAAKQAVDVMVQFKVGASPHVNQVSNPNPASPSAQTPQLVPTPTSAPVQRTLTSQQTQSQTVNATGQKTTPGTQATGILRFTYPYTPMPGMTLTYNAGTVFDPDSNSSQVQMMIDATVTVPLDNSFVTVPAHVVQIGTIGNVQSYGWHYYGSYGNPAPLNLDINNTAPFTGGTDPQTYTVVQQSDIDTAANSLQASTMQSAVADLKSQLQANEHLVGDPQCTFNTTSDHAAGDQATTVTVIVQATCTATAST